MACQKVCKQGMNDLKVKVKIYKALSLHLCTLQLYSSVKKMQGLTKINHTPVSISLVPRPYPHREGLVTSG